jgi:transcription elongation factor Elf1
MTGGDGGDEGEASPRSEVVLLPTVSCPMCGNRNVVVQIEVGRIPILSCTSCGNTSAQPD